MLRCISCPDLVILAYTGDKLWCGQTQNEVKFDFQVKFDPEVRGRSPPKMIEILTKVFYTGFSNLVILAWTADELSCGLASDWYTNWRTHRHGRWQYPKPKLASGNKLTLLTRFDVKCNDICVFTPLFEINSIFYWHLKRSVQTHESHL